MGDEIKCSECGTNLSEVGPNGEQINKANATVRSYVGDPPRYLCAKCPWTARGETSAILAE
jgi:hypothetical protein